MAALLEMLTSFDIKQHPERRLSFLAIPRVYFAY